MSNAAAPELIEKGEVLYEDLGCIACHQGRNVGGNMFQRFGVLSDYFKDKGKLSEAEREELTRLLLRAQQPARTRGPVRRAGRR
jgi:cytochrome c peroxidase